MIPREEVATLQAHVGILAEHVRRLMHVISAQDAVGMDTAPTEAKLEVVENLMWRLHARHIQLKAGIERGTGHVLLH